MSADVLADEATLAAVESAVAHRFADRALLAAALEHPSYAHEKDGTRGNERLEFLGDAVLDLAVAHLLYATHPTWTEGDLTRARAEIVNTRALARCARELGLGGLMRLGRTELRGGGHEKERILANVFEALVAALWLDAGLAPVLALTQRLFGVYLVAGSDPLAADPKTRFQEWCHSERAQTPRYAAVSDSGVENDAHRFVVEVRIAGEPYGRGEGRTKRAAERAAAESALAQLADESTTSPSRRSHDGHQPGGDAPRATSDCARE